MSERKTDISIIIPCYNLENYIGRCLKSVFEQSLDGIRYEIILVSDSCTDRTEEIAKRMLSESGVDFSLVSVNMRLVGLVRNKGLEYAQGKYLYFLDGDDYFTDKYALQKMFERIEAEQTSVVYMTRFESEEPVDDPYAIWRFFIRKSFVSGLKFPMQQMDEDWAYVRRMRSREGYAESRIDDVLYHYTYPREGSITAIFRALQAARNKGHG